MEEDGGGRHAETDDIRKEWCFGALHFLVGDRLAVVTATAASFDRVVATHQTCVKC